MPPSTSSKAKGDAKTGPAAKRRADENDPTISPPPMKRRIQSSTSKAAVTGFFTPTSQKPKDRVVWAERAPKSGAPTTLLVGRYEPANKEATAGRRRKIAAFDLDDTLITTASGKKHAAGAADWKWWHASVPDRLRGLHRDGYRLVVFSNQGGIVLHPEAAAKHSKTNKPATGKNAPATARARLADFRQKCSAVLTALDLPVRVYAATGKDHFRKPRAGMWQEMGADEGREAGQADQVDEADERDFNLADSFFVGDAAGRSLGRGRTKDFSCSDRNFAANVGIAFHTPEEYFLGEAAHPFARPFDLAAHPFAPSADEKDQQKPDGHTAGPFVPATSQEILVFCGSPASGKSSFFHDRLAPSSYQRVNQDTLKTKPKCIKAAETFLATGASIAIDNTNADKDTRKLWIEMARNQGIPARCVWFRTEPAVCEHNDAVRALNEAMNPDGREALPRIAFNTFTSRFQAPTVAEGFAEVIELPFRFRGTAEQYAIWGRYWA